MEQVKTHAHTDVNLAKISTILLKHKWFILGVAIITCLLSLLYMVLKPSQYQSHLLLQLQQKQYSNLETLPKVNQQTDLKTALEEPIAVQMGLMRSTLILRPVIQKLALDIQVTPTFSTILNGLFQPKTPAVQISQLQLPEKYINQKLLLIADDEKHYRLYDNHNRLLIQGTVGQLIDDGTINIVIDHIHAENGMQFTVIKQNEQEVIRRLLTQLKITDLSNASDHGDNKTTVLQLSLVGSKPALLVQTLNQLAKTSIQKNIERKSMHLDRTLLYLKKKIPEIKTALQTAETSLNQYRLTTQQVDIHLQQQNLMRQLTDIDKQLQELNLQKNNLQQKYTKHYPFLHTITDKISELTHERNKRYVALKKLPQSDQTVSSIKQDIQVRKDLYLALLNQIHTLEVIKAGTSSDSHVLLSATNPEVYMPLKLKVITIVSLIIGLMLGCLFVLCKEIMFYNNTHSTNDTTPSQSIHA